MSEPSAPLKSLSSSETNSLVSEMTGGEREEGEVTCQVPLLSTSQIGEGEAEAVPTSVPKISLNNNFDEPEDMESSDSNDSQDSHEAMDLDL